MAAILWLGYRAQKDNRCHRCGSHSKWRTKKGDRSGKKRRKIHRENIKRKERFHAVDRRKNLKGSIRISQEKILLHRVLQVETGRRRKKNRRKEGNMQKAVHPAKLAAAPQVPLNQIPQVSIEMLLCCISSNKQQGLYWKEGA